MHSFLRIVFLSCALLLLAAVGSGCEDSRAGLEDPQRPACVGDEYEPGCTGEGCEPGCTGEGCEPFSIILLPDTQYYTLRQADNASNTYYKQAQWIVDHRNLDNIKFAIHLGDITQGDTDKQWQIASNAHALLDAVGFPYSITTGNHDYSGLSNSQGRSNSKYPNYFGKTRFEGKPFYGGALEDGNFNNYAFFESGPYKFMVLSLEYAPRKDTLCWADNLIRQHPDRRVIIATHCYMGREALLRCPVSSDLIEGASGAETFEELVRRHSNVFMVVAGHASGSSHIEAEGLNGNPIHQMLVDYQSETACTESDVNLCTNHCGVTGRMTGNGWMRKLTFEPKTNTVFATTFTVEAGEKSFFPEGVPAFFCSPLNANTPYEYYGSSPSSGEHQFSFPYALTSPVTYAYSDGGSQAFHDRNISEDAKASQHSPRITIDGTGNFVAVWESPQGIFMRGFHAGGCQRFSSRPANLGKAKQPDVAGDANGNFVVVWSDEADAQIRMRGFHPDGSERFAVQTVGSTATGQKHNPRIAMAPDGRFTVVWEEGPKSGKYQVYVRGFHADGSQRFAEGVVNPGTEGAQPLPAVAMDFQGRSVVVYAQGDELHGRTFNADGSPWQAPFSVVKTGRRPAVGMDASGNFVVAWEDNSAGANNHQVYARGYTHTGGQLFAADTVSKVSSANAGQQLKPSVGMNSEGAFVVAWALDDGTGVHNIRARGFNADGSDGWAVRRINKNTNGQQKAPAVALSKTGVVIHLWEDDMDGDGIFQIMGKGLEGL